MSLEQLVIWIVVGGIAGILADAFVSGSRVDLVGAILGGDFWRLCWRMAAGGAGNQHRRRCADRYRDCIYRRCSLAAAPGVEAALNIAFPPQD